MFVLHLLYDKVVFFGHCVKVEREWSISLEVH